MSTSNRTSHSLLSACQAMSAHLRRSLAHGSTTCTVTRARTGAFGWHGPIDMRMRRERVRTAAVLPSRSTFRDLPSGRRHAVRHRRGRGSRLRAAHLTARGRCPRYGRRPRGGRRKICRCAASWQYHKAASASSRALLHGGRSAANPIHKCSIAPGSWAPAGEQMGGMRRFDRC